MTYRPLPATCGAAAIVEMVPFRDATGVVAARRTRVRSSSRADDELIPAPGLQRQIPVLADDILAEAAPRLA